MDYGNGSFYIDSGFKYTQNSDLYMRTQGTITKNISSERSFLLFARDYNGSINSFCPSTIKVFSNKIWINNNLIRDYIPCYSITTVINADGIKVPANTKGMYDLVEGKFYTNQGSGEDFIAGPEV